MDVIYYNNYWEGFCLLVKVLVIIVVFEILCSLRVNWYGVIFFF